MDTVQSVWKTILPVWSEFCKDKNACYQKQYDSLPNCLPLEDDMSQKAAIQCTLLQPDRIHLMTYKLQPEQSMCATIPRKADVLVGFCLQSSQPDSVHLDLTIHDEVVHHLQLHPNEPTLALEHNCVPLISLGFHEVRLVGPVPADLEVIYGMLSHDCRRSLAPNRWIINGYEYNNGMMKRHGSALTLV